LLYINDADLFEIVTEGAFQASTAKTQITVKIREWTSQSSPQEVS
jgi:hypothetical protein